MEEKVFLNTTVETFQGHKRLKIEKNIAQTEPLHELKIYFPNQLAEVKYELSYAINGIVTDLILVDKGILKGDYTFSSLDDFSWTHLFFTVNKSNLLDQAQVVGIENKKDTLEALVRSAAPLKIHSNCISLNKPVYVPENKEMAQNLTGKHKNTVYFGSIFPTYIDIKLEESYLITGLQLSLPPNEIAYSLYGSEDGKYFKRLYEQKQPVFPKDGIIFWEKEDLGRYDYIRLAIFYQKDLEKACLYHIQILGKEPLKREIKKEASSLFSEITPFKEEIITEKEIIQGVQGIISRRLGDSYLSWFTFIIEKSSLDFFELSFSTDCQVVIKGNNGVSLASGLNYYLKYYCQVNLAQDGLGDNNTMPHQPVVISQPVKKTNWGKHRYAYNYTTHSYTMAFWNEKDWEKEIDWLALNGINLVLDVTGLDALWYEWMLSFDFNEKDALNYLSLTSHSAWQWMGNLSGYGGPLNKEFLKERVLLARHNQKKMRTLGMNIIQSTYTGNVPKEFLKLFTNNNVLDQGTWCGFLQPDLLRLDDPLYKKLAQRFYHIQEKLFGKSHFYAGDLFHEGGNSGDLPLAVASHELMETLLSFDPSATWIIQSWIENPKKDLLKGLENKKDHYLILDLYAERRPNWLKDNQEDFGGKEFNNSFWLFCMLNNFGGRMGLTGHVDTLISGLQKALQESSHLLGIGITPEASETNPFLFDLFLEISWWTKEELEQFDLQNWLTLYSQRRYGKNALKGTEALKLITATAYMSRFNDIGQGAPESVINARPQIPLTRVSTWGNTEISYPIETLEKALNLMAEDNSQTPGFLVDYIILKQQVLANKAWKISQEMNEATRKEELVVLGNKLCQIGEEIDQVSAKIPLYTLDYWLTQARTFSKVKCDYFSDIREIMAKVLITTWGSKVNGNKGGLHDYSNRQWGGLTKSFYVARWQYWLEHINDDIPLTENDWFDWEFNWILKNN